MPSRPVRAIILRQRPGLALATVLRSGHLLGEAGVPVIVGATIGAAVDGGTVGELVLWLGLLAADFVLLSLSWRFGSRRGNRVSLAIAHDLRLAVIDRVLERDERDVSSGELVSIATSDTRRVGTAVGTVISAVVAALVVVVTVVALSTVSPILSAVVVVVAVLVLGLLRRLSGPLEERSSVEQHEAARTAALATDLLAGARTLVGLGAERVAVDRYRAQSQRSRAHAVRAGSFSAALSGLTVLIVGLYLAVVTAVAGALAVGGVIGVAQVVATLGLAQFILGPLETLGSVWPALARGRASAARVAGILDRPAPERGRQALKAQHVHGSVELDSVAHGTLDRFSFAAAPGSFHVIVATDPRDATALIELLSSRLAPEKGSVRLDGFDSREIDLAQWRASLVVAPHQPSFFGVGAAAAITAVLPVELDETSAAVRRSRAIAAAAAGGLFARDDDAAIEHRLSGGELQRVALARALAACAPVLVLAEPTTAVDSVTELFIADATKRLRGGLTTIVLTSSPAFLQVADRVTFVVDGRVRVEASHAELLRSSAEYAHSVLG